MCGDSLRLHPSFWRKPESRRAWLIHRIFDHENISAGQLLRRKAYCAELTCLDSILPRKDGMTVTWGRAASVGLRPSWHDLFYEIFHGAHGVLVWDVAPGEDAYEVVDA